MIRLLVLADARSIHTERWCRYFEDEGFETALFSFEPCTIRSPRHFFAGRRITGIGRIDYCLGGRQYRRVLEQFKPQIVNPHFVTSYGWLAARYGRGPIVTTAWGSDLLVLPKQSRWHRRRVERALAGADYVTVDNDNLVAEAAPFVGREKIVKVIMGVDRKFFDKIARNVFLTSGPLKIIAPRGLARVYNPVTIIEAVRLIKDRLDFKLDLMGQGAEVAKIAQRIEKYSLTDRVEIVPPRPHQEFVMKLKGYELYLSASLSDSTSVALLEAMTAGLVPVVSDIPGNRTWIDDGVNGFLFKAGSPQSLSEAIIKASQLRSKAAWIADTNRRKVATEAIWQDNMQVVKDLFARLVR